MLALTAHIKNFTNTIIRCYMQLRRPAKQRNLRLLQQRGETPGSVSIMEAVPEDIPKLAALHTQAWKETYPHVKNPPVYATREWQWQEQFKVADGSWFCYVAANSKNELVGFVKGTRYAHNDLPGYDGQLQQIYLLRNYQRMGIGKKLICKAAIKFAGMGIHSIVLFGIPQNPSCNFHEAMGGKKLYDNKGVFQGGYGWKSLNNMLALCNPSTQKI